MKKETTELYDILRTVLFKAYATNLLQKTDVYNLTFIQRNVLNFLFKHDRVKMAEMCRMLAVSKPALTRIIDNLEKRKLVKRIQSTKDRRSYAIVATNEARRLSDKLDNVSLCVLDKALANSNNDEIAGYVKYFKIFSKKLTETDC